MKTITQNDFEKAISKMICMISEARDESRYKVASTIFIQPETKNQFPKETISRILTGKRAIPKYYYNSLSNEDFRTEFFKNMSNVLRTLEKYGVTITYITRYIQEISSTNETDESKHDKPIQNNSYPVEIDEGNHVKFIVAAMNEILIKVMEQKSIHVNFYDKPLPKRAFFYGRKDELYELEQSLDNNGHAILSGEPGIGKYEIALKYARDNYANKKYSRVFIVTYQGTLQDTFINILEKYSDDITTAALPNAYNVAVHNMNRVGKKLLVIIRRMNVNFKNPVFFTEFKRYGFHLIITTKSKCEKSICVPYLPAVYSRQLVASVEKSAVDDQSNEFINSAMNPFLLLINRQATKKPEFDYYNHDYLGEHLVSFKGWLYVLYGIKKLPENERHVLKFLSIFSDNTYNFQFVNSICTICTQSMIDTLEVLGWICCAGNGAYYNAYGWWVYFGHESFSESEFSDEISQIIFWYNFDIKTENRILFNINSYAPLALRIDCTTKEWIQFCNHISTQIAKTNPVYAYSIMYKASAQIVFHITEAKQLWNEVKSQESESFKQYKSYVFNNDDISLSQKRDLTQNNFSDRLEYDISIIERLAEQSVHSMLFDFRIVYDCLLKIQKIVECYSSVTNIFGAFESDPKTFIDFVEKVICGRRGEDNTLYKNIVSLCEQNNIIKPKHELIIKMIDLMPMVRMINNLNNIIGSIILNKHREYLDGYIDENYQMLYKYTNEKHAKYSLLFFDIFASQYLWRKSPLKAEKCLNDSEQFISKCSSDIEKEWHRFGAEIVREKIKIYNYCIHNTNDALDNGILAFLEECVHTLSSGNIDYYKIHSIISLYRFVLWFVAERLNLTVVNSIKLKIDEQVKKLEDVGFGSGQFTDASLSDDSMISEMIENQNSENTGTSNAGTE